MVSGSKHAWQESSIKLYRDLASNSNGRMAITICHHGNAMIVADLSIL